MKITLNRKQFGASPVVCSDPVMAEMIAGGSSRDQSQFDFKKQQFLNECKEGRASFNPSFEMCLQSGAKLKLGEKRGHFYIFGYASDGKDSVAAADELKMLYAMRQARRDANALHQNTGRFKLANNRIDRIMPWMNFGFTD